MGQIATKPSVPSIILSPIDRLVAANADGGVNPLASHIVLFGEDAGHNLGDVDYVYVIGADSLNGGFIETVGGEGTTIYGAKNLSTNTGVSPAGQAGPMVVIGYNNLPLANRFIGSSVLIGSQVLASVPANVGGDVDSSVLIGQEVMANQKILRSDSGPQSVENVLIGYRVGRGDAFPSAVGGAQLTSSVIIGAQACIALGADGTGLGSQMQTSVVIGYQAYIRPAQGAAVSSVVAIGAGCAQQEINADGTTYVGAGIITGVLNQRHHIVLGAGAFHNVVNGAEGNILIGAGGTMQSLRSRNIFIGFGVNAGGGIVSPGPLDDHLLIETQDNDTRRNLLYGNMGTLDGFGAVVACGLVLGRSTSGVDRDLPGMNVVKIVDGSWASPTAPLGGGLFYSSGGELHWVSSSGSDFALTPAASLGNFTFATLPLAPSQGARAYVTDALAPAFGAAVAGGGAVFIPVFYDGANWIVG